MSDRISRGPGWEDDRRQLSPEELEDWRRSDEREAAEWNRDRHEFDRAQSRYDAMLPEDRRE